MEDSEYDAEDEYVSDEEEETEENKNYTVEDVPTDEEDEGVYDIPLRRKFVLKELLQLFHMAYEFRIQLDDDNIFQHELELLEMAILAEYVEADSLRYLGRNIYRHNPADIQAFLDKQFERGRNAWWQPIEFKGQY